METDTKFDQFHVMRFNGNQLKSTVQCSPIHSKQYNFSTFAESMLCILLVTLILRYENDLYYQKYKENKCCIITETSLSVHTEQIDFPPKA